MKADSSHSSILGVESKIKLYTTFKSIILTSDNFYKEIIINWSKASFHFIPFQMERVAVG